MGKSRPEYLNRQELRDSEAQGTSVFVAQDSESGGGESISSAHRPAPKKWRDFVVRESRASCTWATKILLLSFLPNTSISLYV